MKKDIILAGVGGQGILSIATVLGAAALEQDLYLKQAEVHGMSQRGGDVQSNLRLSSEPIHSDLIPRGGADLIVSLEPMEALRYLPYLSEDGWIITNTSPFVNIPNYPAEDAIAAALKDAGKVIAVNADQIAKSILSPRSANMVLLGAMAAVLDILDPDKLRDGIRKVFSRKGEAIVETNIKAFDAGFASAQNKR
jgi:indolepyruvate ferredoxin oxidoreductase beta subunit